MNLPPIPAGYAPEVSAAMRNYAFAAVRADRQRAATAVWNFLMDECRRRGLSPASPLAEGWFGTVRAVLVDDEALDRWNRSSPSLYPHQNKLSYPEMVEQFREIKHRSSVTVSTDTRPAILGWIYEDELPPSLPTEAYNFLYPYSKIDNGVRMFPIFGPPL